MKCNVGGVDKTLRIVGGAILVSLVFWGPQSAWGWVGLIPLLSGIFSWCPMYQAIGYNTCPKDNKPQG